jgi:hypothetical protein
VSRGSLGARNDFSAVFEDREIAFLCRCSIRGSGFGLQTFEKVERDVLCRVTVCTNLRIMVRCDRDNAVLVRATPCKFALLWRARQSREGQKNNCWQCGVFRVGADRRKQRNATALDLRYRIEAARKESRPSCVEIRIGVSKLWPSERVLQRSRRPSYGAVRAASSKTKKKVERGTGTAFKF